jgi:acyl carrier protein
MTVPEIEEKLIQGISAITQNDTAAVARDKPFHELGVDSLGFVEILVFIEKTFNLQLISSDLAKEDFETVATLAHFIGRHQ